MRLSQVQRWVVYAVGTAIVLALALGFWPVNAAVFGNPSYSCGSGFVHSGHHWKVDSAGSANARTVGDGGGTPSQVCPSKIYNRRDEAILLIAFALVAGVLTFALTQGPQDRTTSAIYASMRLRKR